MTTDHLYESAIHCRKDDIKGVSECIIMGNMIPLGTGMFKVMYDETLKPQEKESFIVSHEHAEADQLAFENVTEIIKDSRLMMY